MKAKGLTKVEAEIIEQALLHAGYSLCDTVETKDGEVVNPADKERIMKQVHQLYQVSRRVWSLVERDQEARKIGFVQ